MKKGVLTSHVGPGHFHGVARSNSLLGSSNIPSSSGLASPLAHAVAFLVEVEQQVSAVRNLEAAFKSNVLGLQAFHFFQHGIKVDNNSVTQNANNVWVEDTGWDQVKGKLYTINNNSVSLE